MNQTKKIVQQTTNTVTDLNTGEVRQTETTNVYQIATEPPYVKLYLDDLCNLIKIPDAQKNLLMALLRRLDFEGYIILSARARKDIAASLNIKDQTFRNMLNCLCKSEILRRVSTNEYQANPNYFARGEWKSICTRREAFKVEITYHDGQRKIRTGKCEVQQEMDL